MFARGRWQGTGAGQPGLTPLHLTEQGEHRLARGLLLLRGFCPPRHREVPVVAVPGLRVPRDARGWSGFPGNGTCPLLKHGMHRPLGHQIPAGNI